MNEEKMDELLRMMRSVVPDISDMTDAGRIGFVTRGQYSGAESYENLDVVLYGGSLWTPKKDTTGNPPPETQRNEDGTPASNEFWQLFLPGALGDDYVKKTDIAKAPTETESGKPGVNFPDGKTIQIDENGMLTGTPLDFMGTWKELQDGIESGEITEGMTGYIEGTSDNPEDPDHPNSMLIHIDDYPSLVSSNAVQNRIITTAINQIRTLAEQNAQIIEQIQDLRSTLETFGMSKICPVETTDVTENNGIVLGAVEKNASIEGTLASSISALKEKHMVNDVPFSVNSAAGSEFSVFAKKIGKILFLNISFVPSISGEDLFIATLDEASPVFPFNVYNVEFDADHKAKYTITSNESGGANITMSTSTTNFYATLCCCILIQ